MEVIDLLSNFSKIKPTFHTDIVFVRDVRIQAHIGPDAWGRSKPQLVEISARVPFSVKAAGANDSIDHTLDYRQIYKTIRGFDYQEPSDTAKAYDNVSVLAASITGALVFPDVLTLDLVVPKALLHSDGLHLRFHGRKEPAVAGQPVPPDVIAIRKMHVPCIIGIGAHERLQKQVVIVDFAIFAREACLSRDEPITTIFRSTFDILEKSKFLTLEAFVTFLARHLIIDLDFSAAAISAYKPEVFGMADGPGVQVVRDKTFFESQA